VARISTPKPHLDVRDLELVLALAEAGTTVRAASRIHLTQSAVSRGLLAVEDKLGLPLFTRAAKGLTPTPAGEQLIAGAGAVLAQLVELERRTRTPHAAVRVRLVCQCYTAYRWLPSAIASLRRSMPSLEIELAFEHTGDPASALHAGEIEVAFLTTGRVRAPVREAPLFADEIVFVVAADHPLADRATLTAGDLASYPLIGSTSTPEPEVRWFTRAVFGKRLPSVERLTFPLTEATIDAARAGMGVAVLSEWIAKPYLDGSIVAKRMRKRLVRPWRIAFRPEYAEAARQLAAAIGGLAPRLYGLP
jgi:LysR family transcriptional regulator for metE and metH